MPTYSYRCTACDNAFDIHQPFTADSLSVCPVCGGQLRKVFSPVGVSFSGSGFYRTDSRPARPSESGSSDSGSSDAGSSTAADKPAAAPKETATKAAPAKSGASGGSASGSSGGSASGSSGSSAAASGSGTL